MQKMWVGSYTQHREDKGVFLIGFDKQTETFTRLDSIAAGENPSFLTSRGDTVYVVNELMDQSYLTILQPKEKTYKVVQTVSLPGKQPCHVSIQENWLSIAHYGSGNTVVCNLDPQGLPILAEQTVIQSKGSSQHPERQTQPHLHSSAVTGDGQYLFTADLGTDQVCAYPIQNGTVGQQPAAVCKTPPGSGPRGFVWNAKQNRLYIVAELSNQVFTVSFLDEKFEMLGSTYTLPKDYEGESYAGDIQYVPQRNMLLVSNRGHDSVATYWVTESGMLQTIGWSPSGGSFPRSILPDRSGVYLFCANQLEDTITAFRYNHNSGLYDVLVDRLTLLKPTCIHAMNIE